MTVRLFVYGTLAPGDAAWPVLEPWVIGDPAPDAVVGRLYDTGRGYPAATFPKNGSRSLVHGTVVTLDPDRAPFALDALDPDLSREAFEGTHIQRTSVFAEYGWTRLDGFHNGRALILSDRAWRFGLAMEF